MTTLLHEKNISLFLKNIDNPSAFDVSSFDKPKNEEILKLSSPKRTTFAGGTMQGANQFVSEITYNCPEQMRNATFSETLKMEFELKEILRRFPKYGFVPTKTQIEIFQSLLLNRQVFVNSFDANERVLSLFVFLKVLMSKETGAEEKKRVILVAERRARRSVLGLAKVVGVAQFIRFLWMDKTGHLFEIDQKKKEIVLSSLSACDCVRCFFWLIKGTGEMADC